MEFRNLKTFIRISELLNFTQTASELGYSQSAVTMQIQQLEEELGIKLFDRIGKNIKLTDQGKDFTRYATDILKSVETAQESVNKTTEIVGTLKIGMAESLLANVLPSILIQFHKRCPLVETVVKTPLNSEMFTMIKSNDLDIIYFTDLLVYDSEWIKVFEQSEKIHFVAPTEHPFADGHNVSIDEILEEPMILTEKGISYRYELEQAMARQGYELNPILEVGNTDLIIDMLLKNGGISFLPYFAIEKHINNNKLAIINNTDIDISIWNQLVYHRKKWLTPQMKIFIDIVKEMNRIK